jgi:hypothetical protein
MANRIRNVVYVYGPAAAQRNLRSLVSTAESEFDFNAIVPMPEPLRKSEASTLAEVAWKLKYGEWREVDWQYGPDHFPSRDAALAAARAADDWRPMVESGPKPPRSFDELADAVQANIDKYGHPDWYHWSLASWGVKWPACECSWHGDAATVQFETAWDAPLPVLASLSERFPELALRLVWSDSVAERAGFALVQGGQVVRQREGWGDELLSMAIDLAGEPAADGAEDLLDLLDLSEGEADPFPQAIAAGGGRARLDAGEMGVAMAAMAALANKHPNSVAAVAYEAMLKAVAERLECDQRDTMARLRAIARRQGSDE